jgi:NhaP-type Na+/H+ and K+/H+ antiporter
MLFIQLVYVAILILIGVIVLSLRRRANGTRTGYKLLLLLLGMLLASFVTNGTSSLFVFNSYFLKNLCVFLLVVLLFELSVRLNSDNIKINFDSVLMFIVILIANMFFIGIISTFLLQIQFVHSIIFAILISSIEYFLVDQLKTEGDFANPLILFFAFSILVFYTLNSLISENILYFLKYILIGLGTGVIVGIIVFKSLKNQYNTPVNELAMVAMAIVTYIIAEQLSGSGLFAVMVLGTFFGNSYVRKTTCMYQFSPFIFKTLELLIFILIGFVTILNFDYAVFFYSIIIFLIYLIVRFIIIHLFYSSYSFNNKLLLTCAPKGMILGIAILVLSVYGTIESSLITVMVLFLIYSLVLGIVVEYIEQKKELRLDNALKALMTIRFGRKRDLIRK